MTHTSYSKSNFLTNQRSCHVVTCKSNCGQYLHGGLWTQSHQYYIEPPRTWRGYVDDTFVVQQQSHNEEFFQHINTVDPSIQFTVEVDRPGGSIPSWDILRTPQTDGTFTTKVYIRPTHTDLYLQRDSHHDLAAKYSPINTLTGSGPYVTHHNYSLVNYNT